MGKVTKDDWAPDAWDYADGFGEEWFAPDQPWVLAEIIKGLEQLEQDLNDEGIKASMNRVGE